MGPSLPKSILHTVTTVGLQELGVYHILLRICTESTEETLSSFCDVLQTPFWPPLPLLTCSLTPLQPHWPPASSSHYTSAVSGPLLAASSSWSPLILEIHIVNYFASSKRPCLTSLFKIAPTLSLTPLPYFIIFSLAYFTTYIIYVLILYLLSLDSHRQRSRYVISLAVLSLVLRTATDT